MPRPHASLLLLCLSSAALAQAVPDSANVRTVDVTVTDKSGHPVHGLKSSDFTLSRDGAPSQVQAFREQTPVAELKLTTMPSLPPGSVTNFIPMPESGAINVVLIDMLNTPVPQQGRLRQQAGDYLKSIKPGMGIALFGLSSQLTLLQSFTDNPNLLRAAIDKQTGNRGLPIDDRPSSVSGGGLQTLSEAVHDTQSQNADQAMGSDETVATAAKQSDAQGAAFQMQLRTQRTLDGLNLLAHYLSGFPGRKNLIWVAASFPINLQSDPGSATATFSATSSDEFRETADLLARNAVALYPVDATGEATVADRSAMQQMAAQTGGRAFSGSNDLRTSIATAIDTSSNYYSFAYAAPPTGPLKIEIRTTQPGLVLSYRSISDTTETAAAQPGNAAVRLALQHGNPAAAQVVFVAHAAPTSDKTEDALAPNNTGVKGVKGPYRRYAIDFSTDGRNLLLPSTADGHHRASIEFVTFVYDASGKAVNSTDSTITANLDPDTYAKVVQGALLPFHQEASVPAKGTYTLRFVVHDLNSNRVGSLEIPAPAK